MAGSLPASYLRTRCLGGSTGRAVRGGEHPPPPQGVPEDLLLFYNHLRKGGGVGRVDQSLLLYRYHPSAATHSVLEYAVPSQGGVGCCGLRGLAEAQDPV